MVLPASSYARIRQVIWVTHGHLTVIEGHLEHRLEAGDCLGMGPPAEVTIANDSDQPCTYLVTLARS